MGSLDVDAFFTSIPLDETIGICINGLYENCETVENLTKNEMKDLLDLALKNTLFVFDNNYYNKLL